MSYDFVVSHTVGLLRSGRMINMSVLTHLWIKNVSFKYLILTAHNRKV